MKKTLLTIAITALLSTPLFGTSIHAAWQTKFDSIVLSHSKAGDLFSSNLPAFQSMSLSAHMLQSEFNRAGVDDRNMEEMIHQLKRVSNNPIDEEAISKVVQFFYAKSLSN